VPGDLSADDPEAQALLADSVGVALLAMMETLQPAERLAYVLHDLFDVPFDEIAAVVDRSPAATRQLASRARRRLKSADIDLDVNLMEQRAVVDAFLAASRRGDFTSLIALLHPRVVLHADEALVQAGGVLDVFGREAVARTFANRAGAAAAAMIHGSPGAVLRTARGCRVEFAFTIAGGTITRIEQAATARPEAEETATSTSARWRERPGTTAHKPAKEAGAMGVLNEDMKRVVREQRLGFIATVCPDGTPSLSPKGSTAVWDDNHLMFVDMRSPGTIANLRENPAIELNVVDQLSRKGYRFKGVAEVLVSGVEFDTVRESRHARGAGVPMRSLVLMKVERALPISSPGYDVGVSEEELRTYFRRYFESLWDGRDLQEPVPVEV
jgi:predicted pyridoxine 5'-phosphate oxidase superfamily flavin-nucleotide-binding protein